MIAPGVPFMRRFMEHDVVKPLLFDNGALKMEFRSDIACGALRCNRRLKIMSQLL
jgi:hypothetical protein